MADTRYILFLVLMMLCHSDRNLEIHVTVSYEFFVGKKHDKWEWYTFDKKEKPCGFFLLDMNVDTIQGLIFSNKKL